MHLEGSDGGNDDSTLRCELRVAALDIKEFLHTDVSSKASFGDTEAILTH